MFTKIDIMFKYGFKLNKPKLMLKLMKRFFLSKVLGKKPPLKYVDYAFDYRCNLRCEHCFAKEFMKNKEKKMSSEEWKEVAEDLMAEGCYDFNFQGGEPFVVFDDLLKYIAVTKPMENLIAVTTNATIYTEEQLKTLKKVGVDILIVSMDTFRENTKAKELIDVAPKYGLNVAVNTAVSHKNIYSQGFKDIINFAKKKRILLNSIFACPVGAWAGNDEILLTKDDVGHINKLRKKYPFMTRDIDWNFKKGCGAINESIYLTAAGDVLPCPFIHVSFGNVLKESIKNIRNRGMETKYFNHYHDICYASEDRDFIKMYYDKTKNVKDWPLNCKKFLEDK